MVRWRSDEEGEGLGDYTTQYKVAGGPRKGKRDSLTMPRGGGPGDTETKLKKLREIPRRASGLATQGAMYRKHHEASHLGETPYLLGPGQTPDRGIGYKNTRAVVTQATLAPFSLTKFCEAIRPRAVSKPPLQTKTQMSRGCPWYLTSKHILTKLPGTLDPAKYCSRRDGKLQAQFPRSSAGCSNMSPR